MRRKRIPGRVDLDLLARLERRSREPESMRRDAHRMAARDLKPRDIDHPKASVFLTDSPHSADRARNLAEYTVLPLFLSEDVT